MQAEIFTGRRSVRDPETEPGNDQIQKKRTERCQDEISLELSGDESVQISSVLA